MSVFEHYVTAAEKRAFDSALLDHKNRGRAIEKLRSWMTPEDVEAEKQRLEAEIAAMLERRAG